MSITIFKKLFKAINLFLVFALLSFTSNAQKLKIEGFIKDQISKEPIPYATVLLKNNANTFLVGTTTNENGFYSLSYKKGNYTLECSFMGYKTFQSKIELTKNLNQNITLNQEATTIDEVVITAETTTVKQLLDKKVINVGKDILSNGGSAATVLSQLSEIDADESGAISLRGNSNVQVLINGKLSPLGTVEILSQIPASEIATVEIITSPSAKYKADGLTGIINILTKKKIRKGISNSNSASFNTSGGYGANSSLSYGLDKVNFKIGGFYRKNRSNSTWHKQRFGTLPYTENSKNSYFGNVFRINAGLDWFKDKSNEFSWSINYSDNKHHTDIDKTITQLGTIENQNNYVGHRHQDLHLNGNYRHIFKNEKDFIELDIDFSKNNNTLEGYFNPISTLFNNLVDNQILTNNIALDNSFKLSDVLKLETGYLWFTQKLDNDRTFFNQSNTTISDDTFTTKQTTHALYALLHYNKNKWGIQIGLRGENYNRKATFDNSAINVNNSYADLFPSVHFKYDLNDVHTFGIGYNRRTYRPRLYQINPISSQNDAFSFRIGNPNLQPEFSNNLDVTHQFKKGKTSVSTSIFYQKINDIIVQKQTIDSNGVQISSYINGGISDFYGLELGLTYKPTKWLRSNFNFNWNYYTNRNVSGTYPNSYERDYQFTFKNSFKLTKKINTNISWRYRAPSISYYGERDLAQRVDFGFAMKMLKNKANLSLRVVDVLNNYTYQGVKFGTDFRRNYRFKQDGQVVHIAFSYNFNKGKLVKRKKKKRDYE